MDETVMGGRGAGTSPIRKDGSDQPFKATMGNGNATSYAEDRLQVRSLADIEAYERVPLAARGLPPSTYELLRRARDMNPSETAINFVVYGDEYLPAAPIPHAKLFTPIP